MSTESECAQQSIIWNSTVYDYDFFKALYTCDHWSFLGMVPVAFSGAFVSTAVMGLGCN